MYFNTVKLLKMIDNNGLETLHRVIHTSNRVYFDILLRGGPICDGYVEALTNLFDMPFASRRRRTAASSRTTSAKLYVETASSTTTTP